MTNRVAVAAAVAAAVVAGGCSSWPRPITLAAPPSHPIHSVDVLPLDLALWTEAGYDANPEQLRSTAAMNLANTTLAALASRAYGVDALIDWNGDYPGGSAMPPAALTAAVDTLAGYVADGGWLPKPILPVRLGAATGADATLYVGGWAYVANHHESTANKVAEGVTVGVLIAVAVVAAYEVLSNVPLVGGGGGGGRHHGAHGRHTIESPAPAATRGRSTTSDHPPRGDHGVAGDLDPDLPATHHPDWIDGDRMPHDGDSMMFLEMTLIDNRSGLVRWHAHQVFPANAASKADVVRAANALLASLPRA